MNKKLKRFFIYLWVITFSAILFVLGVAFHIHKHPIDNKVINKLIVRSIHSLDQTSRVDIQHSHFVIDLANFKIRLSIDNLTALNKAEQPFIKFEKLEFKIPIWNLLTSNLVPDYILFSKGDINLEFLTENQPSFQRKFNFNKIFSFFKNIKIQIKDVKIDYLGNNLKINNIQNLYINTHKSLIDFDLKINNIAYKHFISIETTPESVKFKTKLDNLNSQIINWALGNKLDNLTGPLQHNLTTNIALEAEIQNNKLSNLKIELDKLTGTYHLAKFFDHQHKIRNAYIKFEIHEDFKQIKLTKFLLAPEEQGQIEITGVINPFLFSNLADLTVQVRNIPVEYVPNYWPKQYLFIKQEVFNYLKSGLIASGKGNFKIDSKWLTPNLMTDSQIQAKLNIINAELTVLEKLDKLAKTNLAVKFSPFAAAFNIIEATFANSKIKNTAIEIPFDTTKKVLFDLNFEGQIKDTLKILERFKTEITQYNVIKNCLTKLNGDIKLSSQFEIPYYGSDINNLNFKISGEFAQLSSANFFELKNGFPIEFKDGTFDWAENILNLKTQALIHQNELKVNLTQKSTLPAIIKIQGNINHKSINKLAEALEIDPLQDITTEGRTYVDVLTTIFPDKSTNHVKLNFTNSNLHIAGLNLNKYVGQKQFYEATIINDDHHLIMHNIILKGVTLNTDPSFLTYNKQKKVVTDLKINNLSSFNNKFSIDYENNQKHKTLDLTGSHLDISKFLSTVTKSASPNEWLKDISIKAALQTVTTANSIKLNNLKIDLNCTNKCDNFHISSHIDHKDNFNFISQNGKDTYHFEYLISDFGKLLNALNISNNFVGGKFNAYLKGIKSDNKIEGKVNIQDITSLQASVLYSILKLTSIGGISSILTKNEKGIKFTKSSSKIAYDWQQHKLTITDGNAKANSIGLTMEGFYNLHSKDYKFNGTLVPNLYGINQLFGKIPVLGANLLGGKNSGIVAVNYTIKGDISHPTPKIWVNPLSILTPGFLRKIFQ
ncbi:hypothetical protein [Rickettsiales endosymbiont of Stachyamoeba lipophora]|uniref:hypothetical protein n=1 Tax=Rickettsiales endosymbiont of Stachyamoeba lipophora TaxID=2486578 RepID=UPI000F650B75|nr:hypothetical protein [Rickettsiales endosymbiont of Stachyamoeba lipophora]AZL16022.1 hypothetical protein EF513_05660 [Rickettsiales endosymbiont of Stachyamoeba lipophora]